MVDKRDIGRDLSRLEDRIAPDADDADRVAAYWEALADAIRDAEAGDGARSPVDLPDMMEFFPAGYDRDDVLDAFAAEDATWGDAVKRATQRRDSDALPADTESGQQDADDSTDTEGQDAQ